MKKAIPYLAIVASIALSGCDNEFTRNFGGMVNHTSYDAERRYHKKSNFNEYYNSVHTRRLIFKGFDTLMVEDDGKISAVLFKRVTQGLPGAGENSAPHMVFRGRNLAWNVASMRITMEGLKENKPRFVTSEVMDGEYDPAADSIWTYYKYKNPQ